MSEIESKEASADDNAICPEQIPTLIRTNQDLVNIWVNETVDQSAAFASIRKVLMKRLAQGIPAITDFDALNVMMDFFKTDSSDHESFVSIAKDSKLVETCRPSYKFMYNNWEAGDKEKASWEFVEERLLRKDNLDKAASMHLEGILFGLDEQGNPMIADGSVAPMMIGMNYQNARKALIKKGWELFPCIELEEKSPEIFKFERFTRKPFVSSPWKYSWLESGENPCFFAGVACFHSHFEQAYVSPDYADIGFVGRGVRALLRAKA